MSSDTLSLGWSGTDSEIHITVASTANVPAAARLGFVPGGAARTAWPFSDTRETVIPSVGGADSRRGLPGANTFWRR